MNNKDMVPELINALASTLKTPLNPVRRDNVVHFAYAVLAAATLLAIVSVALPASATTWLVIAGLACSLCILVRVADGFWQLTLGLLSMLAGIHGVALAITHEPDEAQFIPAGIIVAVYSFRVAKRGLSIAMERDAQARLMDRRNARELQNGWLSREELAKRRCENHAFWKSIQN